MNMLNQTRAKPTTAGLTTPSPWQRVPLVLALVVFAPIALTMGVAHLWGAEVFAAMRFFALFPFLLYVACGWLVIGILFPALRGWKITLKDLGFRNFRPLDLLLAGAAAALGIIVIYPLASALATLIGLEPLRGMGYSLANPLNIIGAVVIASVLGPLAEDVLFRGFLLGLLTDKLRRPWLVAIIGTLAFTLIHIPYFGWGGTLFILLWSPLSVGLFLWRKSIYPSLVLHIINNLVAYVLIPVLRG
jgi:membrane protease YdiL (CAAX protease family)